MKEKNKKREKILVIIALIMLLVLIGLGGTYAFFRVSTGYDSTLANLNIEFQDCLDITYSESNVINLQNQYPVSDDYALDNLTPVTVTVTNSCDVDLNYTLVLASLSNDAEQVGDPEYIPDDAMKIAVERSFDGEEFETFKSPRYLLDVSTVPENTSVYNYISNWYENDEVAQDYTNRTIYKLDSNYVEAGETTTYQTYLWIDYYEGDRTHRGLNDNDTMDKFFKGMFSLIVNTTNEEYPLYSTDSGTLKPTGLNEMTFGNSTINKNTIESIILLDYAETPGNAIKWWDVSNEVNMSVIAWIYDKDNDGLYELYIGQEGGVIAPTNSSELFRDFSQLTYIDVSLLDTSNVTGMNRCFLGCRSLVTLDLSSFDTSNVTNMYSMFDGMANLTTIYVSSLWDTSSVTGIYSSMGMFNNCTSLIGGAGTTYNSSYTDVTYARVDNPPDNPGYFTYKAN